MSTGKPRARSGSVARWLHTDRGMARFLDKLVGAGRWVYDPIADRWMYPAPSYATTPGERCFAVFTRGGDRHIETLPEGAFQ